MDNLRDLVMRDEFDMALKLARTLLPKDNPDRIRIENLAGHTASLEAYSQYYKGRAVAMCPDERVLSAHLQIPRFTPTHQMINYYQKKNILDLGCADGWGLLNLCVTLPEITGVGVDVHPLNTAFAENRARLLKAPLRFFTSSIEEFSIDETFDAILLMEVLEHVLDPVKCFQVAVKHLALYGFICVSVPLSPPEHTTEEDAALHLRLFTKESLEKIGASVGLGWAIYQETQMTGDERTLTMIFSRFPDRNISPESSTTLLGTEKTE